jgi:hypothetical protein
MVSGSDRQRRAYQCRVDGQRSRDESDRGEVQVVGPPDASETVGGARPVVDVSHPARAHYGERSPGPSTAAPRRSGSDQGDGQVCVGRRRQPASARDAAEPMEVVDAEVVDDGPADRPSAARMNARVRQPASPDVQARGCVAHKRNGDRCLKPAIKGATVCRTHGGATKHVQRGHLRRWGRTSPG